MMIRIGDMAINAKYVMSVMYDKIDNRSIVHFIDGSMKMISHSEIAYDQLVKNIEREQQRYAFK
jgi:hypothetical protein